MAKPTAVQGTRRGPYRANLRRERTALYHLLPLGTLGFAQFLRRNGVGVGGIDNALSQARSTKRRRWKPLRMSINAELFLELNRKNSTSIFFHQSHSTLKKIISPRKIQICFYNGYPRRPNSLSRPARRRRSSRRMVGCPC
jgi:hypothetical protein